jgi:hypothetical protein
MKIRLHLILGFLLAATAALSQVPTISSFTPASGPIGTTVTIAGTNFSATPANNIVFFGATRATVTGSTTTQLIVIVPAGANDQPITVLVGGLTGYSSKPFIVTFVNGVGIDANAFAAKSDLTTASTDTRAIATGDIDGDGKPDLIVTNSSSNTISVFRNTSSPGTLSYATRVNFTVGAGPGSIAVGDIDGDGKLDLAVTNLNATTMSVLRNTSTNGTVNFAAKADFATGNAPIFVLIGELDGDGKPDIAVANNNSASVSAFLNTGSPGTISFTTKVDFTTGSFPNSVSINDQDGDGKNDIAVPNYGGTSLSVLRNTSITGTISFATKFDIALSTGIQPLFLSAGDMDADGKSDLVAAVGQGVISIFRNMSTPGSLSYATKVDVSAGTIPFTVGISDFDGDGMVDLACPNYLNSAISIIKNTSVPGTFSFPSRFSFTAGSNPRSLALADQDGDGKMDVSVANGTSGTISVFRNIVKLNQSITFGALSTKTFGDASFTLAATASSGLPVSYVSSNASVATVSGNTVTIIGAGTTTITASQAGDANYAAATSVPQTLTVSKANQAISYAALVSKTFGDAPFNLNATASSGLPISYTSSNTTVATVAGSTVTIVGVGSGSTFLNATQAGNANYNPAPSIGQTLTVVRANQSITFGTLTNKTFGDTPFSLTATTSSSLPVSYTSSNTAVATVSGSIVTIVGAGSTTITASQAGNGNYNPATNVQQALTVSKANQTITFGSLANKTVGDAAFALTATVSSGLSITYSSSNTSVATISGNTITLLALGTTTITASQPGNANYNPATSVQQTLSVKQNQTISFSTLPDKTFGDAAFALNATASSSLGVSYSSSNPAVATVAGNTVTIIGAGTTTITASQAGNAGFNAAADVDQTLTVNKADQNITFATIADKTVGDPSFSLSATASSGNPVTFSTTSSKITLTSSQVTIVSSGRVTVTAAQSGDTNYNGAASVDRSFCIKPAKPIITLSNTNTASPTLTSNASSGNQWYLNGTAISGATNTTLAITQAGVYKVQVQVDDCISTFSDDQPLIVTAVEPRTAHQLNVYPNPASEELIIALSGFELNKPVAIKVVDLLGREFHHTTGKGGEEVRIDVRHYQGGPYILLLTQGHTRITKQFIKSY